MVNTAAIRAAVDGKEWVSMAEFEYSHDKHVLGTDWKSRVSGKIYFSWLTRDYSLFLMYVLLFTNFSSEKC